MVPRSGEPPWVRFARLRRARGLSQRALAAGLVTQSLVSQLERGRVVPARRTLEALLGRLGVTDASWLDEWEGWRQRDRTREQLWAAVMAGNRLQAEDALACGASLLSPFERFVYEAWVRAAAGDADGAERLLWQAWRLQPDIAQARTAYARPGSPEGGSPAKQPEHGHEAAWRKQDRVRAMAVAALAQAEVCARLGREEAARWWRERGRDRMARLRRQGGSPRQRAKGGAGSGRADENPV
ncbi:helix-turn-helix domain-containing protein [Alicyclobacillus macrosporangiidus]|jgi:transcriptional regulator with XRE-family HTH domain|uniref:Helix-turn-helix n=1 Tax=Alicyclobacillus macrosporangiidus TaxID=392015 RepID=A0A1I7GGM8_9BACL|nr:helix-turn-helix transcriptional regulator [Alicyclobacillus macrosporangiidus]SFU47426.1 Helix-turn-helix [Alicyclobacillus macrosporangiidus]